MTHRSCWRFGGDEDGGDDDACTIYICLPVRMARARARARAAAARGLSAEECVPIFGRWSLWSVVSLLYNSISRSRAVDERREERERVVSICAHCALSGARPAGLKNNTAALKMCVIV